MAIDGKFTTVSEATTYLIQQGKVEELKGKSDADVLTLANRLAGEKEQSKVGIPVEKEANPIPQTTAQAANAGAQAVPGGEQSENKASTNRLLSFEGSEAKVDKEAKKQRIQERTEEYKDLKDADGKTLGDNKNFWGVSKAKKLAKEATQEEIAKERVDRSRYYTTQKEYDEAVNADEKNENRHILLPYNTLNRDHPVLPAIPCTAPPADRHHPHPHPLPASLPPYMWMCGFSRRSLSPAHAALCGHRSHISLCHIRFRPKRRRRFL